MKKYNKIVLSVLAALLVVVLAACGNDDAPATQDTPDTPATQDTNETTDAPAGDDFVIALITMDSIDQHWIALREGADEVAAAEGVTLNFMSPAEKDDAQQIQEVLNAVAAGVDAIVIAANHPEAISGALQSAVDAGIVVVYVDSPANVPAEATFSTDNVAAGASAGEALLAALTDAGVTTGDIGIISVNPGTQSTVDRDEGFRSVFAGTDFTILETQFADGDAARSQNYATNFITLGVVGLFGANEGSSVGVGNAIREAGGTVLGGGFDASGAIMNLIEDGYLVFTTAQDPVNMGRMGVQAAINALRNGPSLNGAVQDTGAQILR